MKLSTIAHVTILFSKQRTKLKFSVETNWEVDKITKVRQHRGKGEKERKGPICFVLPIRKRDSNSPEFLKKHCQKTQFTDLEKSAQNQSLPDLA